MSIRKYLTKFQDILDEAYQLDNSIYHRKINEAGMSRIVSKLKDNTVEFAMITAFRGGNSLSKNQNNNDSLLRDLRSELGNKRAYGAYRLVGHYDECTVNLPDDADMEDCAKLGGKLTAVLEEAWLIVNDQKNPKFFDAACKMARKYSQDSFIARTAEHKFGLYTKGGTLVFPFSDISEETFRTGFARMIGERNYSEISKTRHKGRVFNIVFKGIFESLEIGVSVPDDTGSSHRLYHYDNILTGTCLDDNLQESIRIDAATAAWILPNGRLLSFPAALSHIGFVIKNPGKFGLTDDDIKGCVKCQDAEQRGIKGITTYTDGIEDKAWDAVMKKVLMKGFVRLRRVRTGNYSYTWYADIYEFNRKAKKTLSDWAYNLGDKGSGDVVIISTMQGKPPGKMTVKDLSGLFEEHQVMQLITIEEMETICG